MQIRAVADTAAVDAKLQRALSKMKDMQDLLTEFGQVGEEGAKQAHAQEATPGGAAWPDLAASTWRYKTSGKKNWESGALAGSFAARPPSGRSVEVASEGVPYAIYPHTGTKKMPQRRSLPLEGWLTPRMNAIAARHLRSLLS